MDNVTQKIRTRIMQAVRSKETDIELLIRKELWKRGYRYRKYSSGLLGKPDIIFAKKKLVIFIDSCFWHGCPYHCRKPHSHRKYWYHKILNNKKRDRLVTVKLRKAGWTVLRFWEHRLRPDLNACIKTIRKHLR